MSQLGGDTDKPDWAVLSPEDVALIADFGGVPIDKVRGVEMLVLLKLGTIKVEVCD